VVDDSATMRNVIQKVMAKSQFNLMLDVADNGEAALAHCQRNRIHIVFLDLNMPGLNGLETMTQLLDESPMLKVVMVSGSASASDERVALKFGATAFLRKPFYPHHVDHLLREVYHLRAPKTLTVRAAAPAFDVAISGRRVAVVHKPNGHVFEYLWFRDAPHLRNCQVRENKSGIGSAADVREQAQIAALAELRAAALVAVAA
jgi:CheY-like chemotaxis protein